MGIAKVVKTAFDFINKKDFENALVYTSIAVDATSKKEYQKGMSQSARNKKFIDDNQDFIYRFCTGGQVSVTGTGTITYPTGTLGRTLYKTIRCGLLHDGVLPKNIVMLDGPGLGGIRTNIDRGKLAGFAISTELLIALLLLVITSSKNKSELIDSTLMLDVYNMTTEINTIWGKKSHLSTYPIYS